MVDLKKVYKYKIYLAHKIRIFYNFSIFNCKFNCTETHFITEKILVSNCLIIVLLSNIL